MLGKIDLRRWEGTRELVWGGGVIRTPHVICTTGFAEQFWRRNLFVFAVLSLALALSWRVVAGHRLEVMTREGE